VDVHFRSPNEVEQEIEGPLEIRELYGVVILKSHMATL
jgi:hypothetical protein